MIAKEEMAVLQSAHASAAIYLGRAYEALGRDLMAQERLNLGPVQSRKIKALADRQTVALAVPLFLTLNPRLSVEWLAFLSTEIVRLNASMVLKPTLPPKATAFQRQQHRSRELATEAAVQLLLEECRFTLNDVEVRCGITATTIMKRCNGKDGLMRLALEELLRRVLDTGVEEL